MSEGRLIKAVMGLTPNTQNNKAAQHANLRPDAEAVARVAVRAVVVELKQRHALRRKSGRGGGVRLVVCWLVG